MNTVEKEKTDHDAEKKEDIPPAAIEAPGKNRRMPTDPIKLIFEIVLLIVAFIPMIVWSIIKYFLTQPKSIKGKVVLVSI